MTAAPFAGPLVSPLVVGRAAELAELQGQLDAACVGTGRTVLLAGEAGIGKSRLVAEARQRASDQGMLILEGRCFEPDRAIPYAALIDLLRTHFAEHSPEPILRELRAIGAQLAQLLPELSHLLPEESEIAALNPEQEKRRLVHTLAQVITHLAGRRPVLLVVEDLHWSDDAGLDFVLHLARRVAAAPVVLLLTYRSDEIGPSLRHVLAQLDRERLAREITLTRLARDEIDLMLRAIFAQPRPIRADFLHAVYELTDGNPFFTEEVVGALVAAGDIFRSGASWERRSVDQLRIPRSVHDAVLRRVQLLSPHAVAVLRLAAVAGRSFDFDVLLALTDHDEADLLALIHELSVAQLVVEESADRFTFRHALTRQAIYAGMLARERRALHLAIAREIEQRAASPPDVRLTNLSYHFSAGEDWAKALEYGQQAGRRALGFNAPRAAVEHFGRAIDAAARLEIEPSAQLYRARGRALALLGDFDGAQADCQAALERARVTGDRFSRWQATLDLGDLWAGYDYRRAGHYLEEAHELAQTLDSSAAQGESLALLGSWYLNIDRVDEAEDLLQSALRLYQQTGDRRGIARAVDLLGTVSDIAGDVFEMRRRYERAARLFRELDDREGLSSTLATLALQAGAFVFETVVTPPGISLNQAMSEIDEAVALAREIGWRAGEAYALGNAAVCLGPRGDYGRALEIAPEALAVAEQINHREWMTAALCTRGAILLDLLLAPLARQSFAHAYDMARASGSLHWLYLTTAYLAETDLGNGDQKGAAALLASVAPDLPTRTLGQRRIWTVRARLALSQGAAGQALAIVDRLFAGAANLSGEGDIPLLALLRGDCLTALDRDDDAEAAFKAARDGAIARGLRPREWRAHLALGRLFDRTGRSSEARQRYQLAWAIIDELAATLPDDLRLAHLAGVGTTLPLSARRARLGRSRHGGSLLTARERDVAGLVARGLSNRQIADRLSIGERTVETHVGNILGKLEFGSRAQIAAWAAQGHPERISTPD